ncbi:unnamed protein product [Cyprideis torosa]|uniref:Uncharacterized protein n=1 Tax=Cyprideis torosa TaxID=163714 RepID=A0A7R8WLX9_9CRUS|nr:unnamed protein product [Cyprideis torosa]CAG0903015.1 unnamed protein product [Cyprideis torosa]
MSFGCATCPSGGSHDLQGYMPRQPLYSCETCGTADPAAICLACSLHCHADHSMIELYTKRRVRCDCGNNKFGARLCKLEPKKDATNEKNVYNQNYKGLYCTCHRPYPDLEGEDDNPDEMIQCVVCEDWFHSKEICPKTLRTVR